MSIQTPETPVPEPLGHLAKLLAEIQQAVEEIQAESR